MTFWSSSNWPIGSDAADDRRVRLVGIGVGTQRVGTESADDLIAILDGADRALRRPDEIDGRLGDLHAHPHGRRVDRTRPAIHPEPAEQAEVHMADETVPPVVEEVLAVGLDFAQPHSVDQRGIRREPALRRRDGDFLAAQELRMIDGNSVKRVTLGHAGCDVTGTLGAS